MLRWQRLVVSLLWEEKAAGLDGAATTPLLPLDIIFWLNLACVALLTSRAACRLLKGKGNPSRGVPLNANWSLLLPCFELKEPEYSTVYPFDGMQCLEKNCPHLLWFRPPCRNCSIFQRFISTDCGEHLNLWHILVCVCIDATQNKHGNYFLSQYLWMCFLFWAAS